MVWISYVNQCLENTLILPKVFQTFSFYLFNCGTAVGVTPLVPKALTSNNRAEGLYDRQAFIYQADKDEYRCPANQALIKRYTSFEQGKVLHTYWSSACKGCALKSNCTPSTERRIRRWEHEAVLDEMQSRLNAQPDAMLIRKQTVEHPFGCH